MPRRVRGAAALLGALTLQGCLATRQDVALLQDELRTLRATVAASDSARAQDARTLLAAVRRTDDSIRAVGTRVGRLQGEMSDQFLEVNRQLIAVQELTGQSQRRLQELRASLEDQAMSAPPAVTAPAPASPDAAATPALPGPNRLFEVAREQLDRGSPTARWTS